ncbi:HopJ type III effector protein [Vibrio mangrovi]|uniref:HopJ type III effector protein n=1 Tax=Vibrio mangrovi TaxID=474394 RepID=A0A1Y6IVI3_9VIBR|nr:HopJ type III effector protein [Vibrio mangrovi]MDW6004876.1 HopJ type III effector protein [Vibrio mangrovi]SMS01638.1 HopJ type III effector protein [Vibrio mangrovi]
MTLNELLEVIRHSPEKVDFFEVINVIDTHYDFTPTRFTNGELVSEAHENQGSCKIFSFAGIHQLNPDETLACFGDFYRQDVLAHPENQDHQNIRNFIRTGWEGIQFEGEALQAK